MLAQLAALPESLGKADTLLADTGYFSAGNVVSGCQNLRIFGEQPIMAPTSR
jgi:hypothetical protein